MCSLARLVLVATVTLAAMPSTLLAAAPATPETGRTAPQARSGEAGRRATLDDLFARLAAAKDEEEAKGVAQLIERRFQRSGSDTADLLMVRSAEALESKDAALAIELLDRVTQLKPDWAEAWARRASAFYLLDDPVDATADLHKALEREPRLFAAWAALGHIAMANDDKRQALAAFRRALAIHPFLDVKRIVERLAPEIDGRDL